MPPGMRGGILSNGMRGGILFNGMRGGICSMVYCTG